MDRRLGEPLPHQLSNPTRAHPCAINLWHHGHATSVRYAVLSSVSRCYPPHKGRLLTRYSPVRHCSVPKDFTVRLECVMHAASVHPEPGSNSRTNYISSPFGVETLSSCFWLFLLFWVCFLNFEASFFKEIWDFALAFLLVLLLLLFSCQWSISAALFGLPQRDSPIIPHPLGLVNRFFQSFLNFFQKTFSLPLGGQLFYYTTPLYTCQAFFSKNP